jgi:lipoprotein NlpD
MVKLKFLFIIIFIISCAPAKSVYKKAPPSPTQIKGSVYLVKEGDSLWRIARKYDTSVEELMHRNKISSAQDLKVGQKIVVTGTSLNLKSRPRSSSILAWPIKGQVINFFGETVNSSVNKGLNIKAAGGDKSVKASAQGKVVFANQLKGWGKTVILKHDLSLYTIYANLASTLVSEGAVAKKGQSLGQIASGHDGNYILHFEVRKRYLPHNPLKYLN